MRLSAAETLNAFLMAVGDFDVARGDVDHRPIASHVSAMKIAGPGPLSPTSNRPKRTARGAAASEFASEIPEETSSTTPALTTPTVGAIEGILAIQEVEDATQGRSRGLARAHDMLERLDEIQHGLLVGCIPRSKLVALRQQVRDLRSLGVAPVDARLAAILEEIDLRASVELAKLEMES